MSSTRGTSLGPLLAQDTEGVCEPAANLVCGPHGQDRSRALSSSPTAGPGPVCRRCPGPSPPSASVAIRGLAAILASDFASSSDTSALIVSLTHSGRSRCLCGPVAAMTTCVLGWSGGTRGCPSGGEGWAYVHPPQCRVQGGARVLGAVVRAPRTASRGAPLADQRGPRRPGSLRVSLVVVIICCEMIPHPVGPTSTL